MTFKTILPFWLGLAFLCLFVSPAQSQTQAEAGESYLHLQNGDKQRLVEPGDQVSIRTNTNRRRIKGTLYHVTDSTLILRKGEVPIAAIQNMNVRKRVPRKLALWLLLGVVLSPLIIAILLTIIIAVIPAGYFQNNYFFWREVQKISRVVSWMSLVGAAVASIFSFKRYNLKKWKMKVRKRRYKKVR